MNAFFANYLALAKGILVSLRISYQSDGFYLHDTDGTILAKFQTLGDAKQALKPYMKRAYPGGFVRIWD